MEESKTAQSTSTDKSIHSNRKSRGVWFYAALVSVVCLVIVVVLGLAGTLTGRLAIVVKNPNTRITMVVNVCGESVINSYNSAMDSYYQGYSDAIDKISTTVSDFSKLSGYEGDPSCAYIKFRLALLKSDSSSAQTQIDIISTLSSQNKYIDARLYGVTSIDAMRATVASMVAGKKESDD